MGSAATAGPGSRSGCGRIQARLNTSLVYGARLPPGAPFPHCSAARSHCQSTSVHGLPTGPLPWPLDRRGGRAGYARTDQFAPPHADRSSAREGRPTVAAGPVLFVSLGHARQLCTKQSRDAFGEWYVAVFLSLPVAYEDLLQLEVDVFHAQPETFLQSQPRRIEERRDEKVLPDELTEYTQDFAVG